jgi:hypothetical protein
MGNGCVTRETILGPLSHDTPHKRPVFSTIKSRANPMRVDTACRTGDPLRHARDLPRPVQFADALDWTTD